MNSKPNLPRFIILEQTIVAWMHQRWVWHTTALAAISYVAFYEDLKVRRGGAFAFEGVVRANHACGFVSQKLVHSVCWIRSELCVTTTDTRC